MHPEDGPHGQIEPVADPDDLIVGTIRPPSWLGRIPALAWLFIALAVLDGVWRVGAYPIWVGPTGLASLGFSVVSGVAAVLLPAAILLGRPRLGQAGSWLLQGALALAVAELLGHVGRDFLDMVAGPDVSGSGLFGTPGSLVRTMATEVTVVVLRILGLARIGLGLRAIAVPTRPFGRILFAAPAAALAVLLLADLLTIQVSQAAPATVADAIQLGYNLLILVGGAVVLVLWAWIASLAYRQDGRTWRSIMIGALAIALGSVVIAIGWIVALQRADTDDAQTILTWFGVAASAVGALGAALLLVGFGRGFEPLAAADASETAPDDASDVGPATRPLGV